MPETAELKVQKEIKKPKPLITYGFNLDNFTLHHDTIQNGDSFGKILGRNGFTSQEIFNTVETVKDSFNTAKIIAGKPYILIKSKEDPEQQLSALVYQ